MFKKITTTLLVLAGFLMVYANMSNKFDFDLGWHLRFGKEAVEQKFPYQDSYTWSHLREPWVNHEWGGDLLFWLLYHNFGYPALLLLTSAAVWAAFVFMPKIFDIEITPASIAISLLGAWSVQHIINMRLASFGPLFFLAILYTLRHMPQKKLYWSWPLLLWLWSALHGSWILGFIIIGIYTSVEFAKFLLKKFFNYHFENIWSPAQFLWSVLMTFVSAAILVVNPYGLQLWKEVISYFGFTFYKSFIIEWMPSYAYPIFFRPLLLTLAGMVSCIVGIKKRWLKLADVTLFTALLFAAFTYKRQALFLILLCIAVLTRCLCEVRVQVFFENIVKELGQGKKYVGALIILVLLLLCVSFFVKIDFRPDVWSDHQLLEKSGLPVKAVAALLQEPNIATARVFNEFNWGGYLAWELPSSTLIYFDGRGAATWMHSGRETELEHFFDLRDESTGLKELERDEVKYIILAQPTYSIVQPPDFLNRLIFKHRLEPIPKPVTLLDTLRKNTSWQEIYSDETASIWRHN